MNIRTFKTTFLLLLAAFTMIISGCSSDYLKEGYVPPHKRPAVKVPEIQQQTAKSRAPVIKVVKPYEPAIKKYTISSSSTTVVNPNVNNGTLKSGATIQSSVDVDPYASIPESSSLPASISSTVEKKSQIRQTSPAVKSLLSRARADLSIGRTQSAVSKLERGLRIEAQNPSIWHLLAKAQYDQSNHQQSISMAKKSIRYSDDDKLTAQNWKLIQKAGEKSDDAIAIKEALDYFKVNP